MTEHLTTWNDTPTRAAIEAFVAAATTPGDPGYLEPAERIAVFDNDGTLWTEKPVPVQLDFIVRELAAAAEADASLREREPYRAARERDLGWLESAFVKHYQGDDTDLRMFSTAVTETVGGRSIDDYAERVRDFFATARHPSNGRLYTECAYAPMLDLLRYLEAHGFLTFIVSGGDRDFMRPIAESVYELPRERVVGSSFGLDYTDGGVIYKAALDVFDVGPQKALQIWAHIGRRPAIACGNSNGDVEMLRFAGSDGRAALRLVVGHDDAEREAADHAGADAVLTGEFTVISMKADWATVYGT